MEKSYGEIDKRNSQGNNDDISKQNNVVVGHPLPKDEIISDTFKRTVNTHDVQGKIFFQKNDFIATSFVDTSTISRPSLEWPTMSHGLSIYPFQCPVWVSKSNQV